MKISLPFDLLRKVGKGAQAMILTTLVIKYTISFIIMLSWAQWGQEPLRPDFTLFIITYLLH